MSDDDQKDREEGQSGAPDAEDATKQAPDAEAKNTKPTSGSSKPPAVSDEEPDEDGWDTDDEGPEAKASKGDEGSDGDESDDDAKDETSDDDAKDETSDDESDDDIKDEESDRDSGQDKKHKDESVKDDKAAASETPLPTVGEAPKRKPAAWGRPLARLDASWSKFEARLCAVVLILEILSLSLWVALRGLSSSPTSGGDAGIVFRAIVGATLLSAVLHYGLKYAAKAKQLPEEKIRVWGRVGGVAGVVIGAYCAKYWANLGINWASNLLNWYAQASSLTLLNGLRGVGTRLTLLLALLGGSLATAAGKHITIDLITRFLKHKQRVPVILVGWVGASVICFAASWGFFDHIAIEDFGASADARPKEKFAKVGEGLAEDFFIARKQFMLDLKSAPHVLKGENYADWLTGAEWNAWLDDSGFAERYGKEKVEPLKIPDGDKRSPIVTIPEKGEPRGELINAFNLVFPIGLFIIAVRFILLCLLTMSGHMSTEPELEGSDIKRKHEGDVLDEEA